MMGSFLMWTSFALFSVVLHVVICKEMKETCVGDQCKTPGRSVLQVTKQAFDIDKLVEKDDNVEDKGSMESKPELTLRQEGGMMIEKHGKFEIRNNLNSVNMSDDAEQRWIISCDGGCPFSELKQVENALLSEMNEDFISDSEHGGLDVLVMNGSKSSLKKGLDRIQASSINNMVVEEDGDAHIYPVTNPIEDNTMGQELWGLDRIDDRSGYDNSYSPPTGLTGEGVNVFVLDTGIRTTHTDFEGRAVAALDTTSGTPVPCHGDVSCAVDRNGHGTHCAGTVGGKRYGVAKKSKLLAVKVLRDDGSGYTSGVLEGFDWVKKQQVASKIISCSLGSNFIQQSYRIAVDGCTAAGIVVVVASGNDSHDACRSSPGYVPSAITVSATTNHDTGASFTNYGSCVDIFAPGKGIKSAGSFSDTSDDTFSGTSMACPHVSGAAALILHEDPTRTVAEVDQLLKDRSTKDTLTSIGYKSPNFILYTGLDIDIADPTPPPTPVPPACGFDESKWNGNGGAYCGLWRDTAVGDQFDWTLGDWTPTGMTGPYFGLSGKTWDSFLYIKSSSPRISGDKAILEAGPVDIHSDLAMRFHYHMRGHTMGSLAVKVNGVEVWSKSGNQGYSWLAADVNLSSYVGTAPTIAFVGTCGSDIFSDAAIDEVEFIPAALATTSTTTKCVGWHCFYT